jgi:ADP-heptose:LPS heptosyltransferase
MVPDKYKRPFFAITEKDLEEMGELRGRSYVAFQLRATNISRTIPPHVLDMVLGELNKIGLAILCLDDVALTPEVAEIVARHENAVDFSRATKDNIRKYGTIICNAALVVGPDSSALHFAASHDVPTISLWAAFDPDSRVRYYGKNISLMASSECSNWPCHNFREKLPAHKCPQGSEQRYCAVIEGITRDSVSDAIRKHGF